MAKTKVCATCGFGATEKLLATLKDEPEKVTTRSPPPKRISNKEKSKQWAQTVLRKSK